MPNLNLLKEAHELTNIQMLFHVWMVHYFIEFNPHGCSFPSLSMWTVHAGESTAVLVTASSFLGL